MMGYISLYISLYLPAMQSNSESLKQCCGPLSQHKQLQERWLVFPETMQQHYLKVVMDALNSCLLQPAQQKSFPSWDILDVLLDVVFQEAAGMQAAQQSKSEFCSLPQIELRYKMIGPRQHLQFSFFNVFVVFI